MNVTDTTTSAVVHQYAYDYDAAGNRTTEQIDGNVTTSAYNNLNQLTSQSAGGKMVFSGTISKYATVTVGGTPASLDASNNFRGTAAVTTGTNNVPVVATDVDGNSATNTYQVVVPSGTSGSNSYDYNGNLLNDGTRHYAWDAKNELVKITYADTSYTAFTYNGLGQRVEIQEYNASNTLISTKQYVFAGGMAEERDASNLVTKRYFSQGEQRISGSTPTSYFYTYDHLGSVREMMASNGTTIDARYSYDPYGRATQVSGSISCDFQYAGMYYHATSGLNLTKYRAYNPSTGTWISRDPSGESSGLNLYAYCGDNPVCNTDSSGLCIDDNPFNNPDLSDFDDQNYSSDPTLNTLLFPLINNGIINSIPPAPPDDGAVQDTSMVILPMVVPESEISSAPNIFGIVRQMSTYSLIATEKGLMSNSEYSALKNSISKNGIQDPLKYIVGSDGLNYVVLGNNRLQAAKELGLGSVPTLEISLPFRGYTSDADLLPYYLNTH